MSHTTSPPRSSRRNALTRRCSKSPFTAPRPELARLQRSPSFGPERMRSGMLPIMLLARERTRAGRRTLLPLRLRHAALHVSGPPQIAQHVGTCDEALDGELLVRHAARTGAIRLLHIQLVQPVQPRVRALQIRHHIRAHVSNGARLTIDERRDVILPDVVLDVDRLEARMEIRLIAEIA